MNRKLPVRSGAARRALSAIGAAALLLAVSAPATLAAKPDREFLDADAHLDIQADEACGFPVGFDTLTNNEYITFFVTHDGSFRDHISGRLVARLTHGDKGVVLNISGPGYDVPHDDGSVTLYFLGNALIWAPGYMITTSGQVSLDFGADGSVTNLDTSRGHVTDICALLA
jgi:hypothetical protein